MDDPEPTEEKLQIPHEQLTPGETANFPGSLAVSRFDPAPKATAIRGNKGKTAAWAVYFTEGWDDIGIWKSAVSILT